MKATMLTAGAVISGSVVLEVVQRGEFVPQDLDIYVTSVNMATVLVFLQEQGYAVGILVPGAIKNRYPKSPVTLTLRNHDGEKIGDDRTACHTCNSQNSHPTSYCHLNTVCHILVYSTCCRIQLSRDN